MIDFEGYYTVAAEQIKYIATDTGGGEGYPYQMNMYLLSGETLTIRYRTKAAVEEAKRKICREIESERRRDAEKIQYRLYLIEQTIKGLDKRQFRIWKQLKTLLNVEPDEKN